MRFTEPYKIIVLIVLVIIVSVLFVYIFYILPINDTSLAIDWKTIWRGIQGGKIQYGMGLRNPPWSVIPVLPLGFLPFRLSWAVLSFLTILILIISVPRSSNRGLYILACVLLATSFNSIRHLADGNLEAFVIAGILLCLFGYKSGNLLAFGIGLLLSLTKPQESWLFLIAISFSYLVRWSIRSLLGSLAIAAIVIIPTMVLEGAEWLQAFSGIEQRQSIMDASLIASMNRIGMPVWIIWIMWTALFLGSIYLSIITRGSFGRIKSGHLVAASLLLAPYAAGNSLLTVLAIGTIPLFMMHPLVGILLIAAINIQYLFPQSFIYNWGALYATSIFMLNWFVFGFFCIRKKMTFSG